VNRFGPIICLAVLAVAPAPAHATVAQSFRVSQPGGAEGENIVTTYVLSNSWYYPIEIAYTANPNCVSVDGKFQDINAAVLYGLKVQLVPQPGSPPLKTDQDFRDLGVYGDTAWVVLDVSAADTTWCDFGNRIGALNNAVERTIDCVFLNARRSWPKIHYLKLEILGTTHFTDFQGVHSLEKVPHDEDSNRWWNARSLLK